MILNKSVKTPWYPAYGNTPPKLNYPKTTLFEEFENIATLYPDLVAYEFMGKKTKYSKAYSDVIQCGKALKSIGIQEGERVTICLPNCPQAITMFYAVNMIGAVANMIHPLSSPSEIEFYLHDSQSVAAITLDLFWGKFESLRNNTELPKMIIGSVGDALSSMKRIGYKMMTQKKITRMTPHADTSLWNDFMNRGHLYLKDDYKVKRKAEDPAVILYSGGTTGVSKGILLSNYNFNCLGRQIMAMEPEVKLGDSILAVMPLFHGFGLGVSIHSFLANGGRCILVPRFTVQSYANLIRKCKPNYIAGVPTLFEAILRLPSFKHVNLSSLKGIFSGGDSLSPDLKKRLDQFLFEHKCRVQVQEGYGLTECVTASCLTPKDRQREGSIGIPLPDMLYKIVKVGTDKELPYGENGEICISGPTVMLGYVNQPEETAATLRKHKDGLVWLHTGDYGAMDAEGWVYFKQRIKRMIVTNGYNVYPSQIERILDMHEAIHLSCVIGVKDPIKIQKVKAYVMLKPGFTPGETLKKSIIDHCRQYIAKYALPYDLEFRDELPKTKIGKVAYKELEDEENAKIEMQLQAAAES